ncbi:hypothetical protein JXB12_07010 [candidate division KSB1 bacterium]|nr:hypothetical protein [candidate division KSB1 bacterium]
MEQSHRSVVPGAVLILVGILLLIHELDFIPVRWSQFFPVILVLIGLLLFIWGIRGRIGGGLFWGIVFLGAGIFYVIRNYELIPYHSMPTTWPIFSIILGIAFLSLFILNRNDWGVLIPAIVLLLIGLNYFLDYFNYWRLQEILHTYWPLSLVLAGVFVIVVSLNRKKE